MTEELWLDLRQTQEVLLFPTVSRPVLRPIGLLFFSGSHFPSCRGLKRAASSQFSSSQLPPVRNTYEALKSANFVFIFTHGYT
jgi:hypothetical protein